MTTSEAIETIKVILESSSNGPEIRFREKDLLNNYPCKLASW
jgi:hypothetical protein